MSNVPNLRFKEFDGEWHQAKLGDYGILINGLTYSPTDIVNDGGLLVLRSSNIQNERMSYDDNVYVGLEVKADTITQPGDILICVRNGSKRLIGKNTLVPIGIPRATHGAFMTVFRSPSNQFIAQWLKSAMYAKQVYVNLGATINSINGGDLKRFKVAFPDDAEQQKIADFLTAVDTKIEQLTKKEELLKQYKKGVMHKIFSQEIRFKADDGSELPVWTTKRLGDIGSFRSGVGFPPSMQGGVTGDPLYKVSDMSSPGNHHRMMSANNYVSDEQIKKLGAKLFSKPSVIFAKVGAAIYLERKRVAQKFLIDNNMMAFTPNFNVDYLYQWMMNLRISKFAQVGALPSLNASDLKTIQICLPSKEEQQKIADFLTAVDSRIDHVSQQVSAAKAFKKGLLQQMFV